MTIESAPSKTDAYKVISLDFCADQYVLKFVPKQNILALSPDSQKSFSYMRSAAKDIPQIRPRAEDILLLNPDIVVRSYGGGPMISRFLERANIEIVQLSFANDLLDVAPFIDEISRKLDNIETGKKTIADFQETLRKDKPQGQSLLYLTSKGASAGPHTMIDDIITTAGFENFQRRSGWASIPLERLAYESPDFIATGFFETSDLITDQWTPATHPIVKTALAKTPNVNIPGDLTACSGWFLGDAIDLLRDNTFTDEAL